MRDSVLRKPIEELFYLRHHIVATVFCDGSVVQEHMEVLRRDVLGYVIRLPHEQPLLVLKISNGLRCWDIQQAQTVCMYPGTAGT